MGNVLSRLTFGTHAPVYDGSTMLRVRMHTAPEGSVVVRDTHVPINATSTLQDLVTHLEQLDIFPLQHHVSRNSITIQTPMGVWSSENIITGLNYVWLCQLRAILTFTARHNKTGTPKEPPSGEMAGKSQLPATC